MKIVVSSDWHLDAVTDGFNRFDDLSRAVDEVVGCVEQEQASLFMFLGDLCDPDTVRSHRAVAKAVQVAQRLPCESIWLTGNHDVIEDGSGTSTLQALGCIDAGRVHLIDRPTVTRTRGSVVIVALPFVPRVAAYDPAAFIREVAKNRPRGDHATIVIGHLNLEGITPGSETTDMPRGRDVFWPTTELRKHFPDAILLGGHYHRRQVHDGVHIVGSLERLTHGEEDHRPGFLVVEV